MKPDSTETAAAPLWRGLDELEASPEYQAAALNEFPEGATEFTDEPSRRRFLALMGASLALSTGVGCNSSPRRPSPRRQSPPPSTRSPYAHARHVPPPPIDRSPIRRNWPRWMCM